MFGVRRNGIREEKWKKKQRAFGSREPRWSDCPVQEGKERVCSDWLCVGVTLGSDRKVLVATERGWEKEHGKRRQRSRGTNTHSYIIHRRARTLARSETLSPCEKYQRLGREIERLCTEIRMYRLGPTATLHPGHVSQISHLNVFTYAYIWRWHNVHT